MSRLNNTIVLQDGRKLGFAEYGDPKGKPLFYFHGWPGSRMRPGFNHKEAKALKVRIICPDRPGYGISDYQENRTFLDWPKDVIKLANKLKIKKFAVVGVSGGGPYAAACAYKIPNRITKAGIVVGAGPMQKAEFKKGMPLIYRLSWINYSKYPFLAYLSTLIQLIGARYLPILSKYNFKSESDRKFYKKYGKEFIKITKEAFRQGPKGPARDLILYTKDWEFKLKDIKAKVYLWYGDDDKNVPIKMGKYLASQIPNSKLAIYPNEGHLISVSHAKEILRELVK
jgi:pimeloyl-ACP methyl ester carboxylesterase